MTYAEQIRSVHETLGIPPDYAVVRGLRLIPEGTPLVDVGPDTAGRPARLTAETRQAWRDLQARAAADGHVLELVSAFRSVDYQRGIIERKRARGLSWDEIFRFSAAPGYSEHHTGCAVDINCPGCRALEAEFADTPTFTWLCQHAPALGWRLSYPAGNPHGFHYEPWHWFFERAV